MNKEFDGECSLQQTRFDRSNFGGSMNPGFSKKLTFSKCFANDPQNQNRIQKQQTIALNHNLFAQKNQGQKVSSLS
jgi:hypothetical protein